MTPSVSAPGDTNLSDATASWHFLMFMWHQSEDFD